MAVAYQVLVLAHLVGFAALLGGILVQLRDPAPEVNGAMLAGAWTGLGTGVALAVAAWTSGAPLEEVVVGVKLAVTLFLVLLVARNRRFTSIPRGLWALLGGLTLLTAALSLPWT